MSTDYYRNPSLTKQTLLEDLDLAIQDNQSVFALVIEYADGDGISFSIFSIKSYLNYLTKKLDDFDDELYCKNMKERIINWISGNMTETIMKLESDYRIEGFSTPEDDMEIEIVSAKDFEVE
jgi:hypothetical protein